MKQTGSLEVGKCADFITIDPSNKPHLQPADEVLSHLVYAASGKDISDVIINGKRVVWNGECKTLDEERIIFEASRYKRGLQRYIFRLWRKSSTACFVCEPFGANIDKKRKG